MSVYKSLPSVERPFIAHPAGASLQPDRRSHLRRVFFVLFAFFFAGTLSYLVTKHPTDSSATVTGFNPGNIINDYTMGNYQSMTEAEIQAFLTAKNPCSNTNYSTYQYLIKHYNEDLGKPTSTHSWHFEDGHFVCLSEERFGEGTAIGVKDGETAAHIIWQAAQDYKINPQVLIVLLEKEQGLISDSIPRSGQYRSATGYGCPDTAACDAKYYGFKNQIRNAAALFRSALDGKSSYYPIGNNYVLYNPNSSCGGSWVNIENLATGVLYRYTPYQPNSAALAAGTGYGNSCSAYGNRNFYHFFTEWFGSTQTSPYTAMSVPRIFEIKTGAKYIDTSFGTQVATASDKYAYFTHRTTVDGQLCLMTSEDIKSDRCILYSSLVDYPTIAMEAIDNPRYLATTSASYLNVAKSSNVKMRSDQLIYFGYRITISGKLYVAESAKSTILYPYDNLKEITVGKISQMDVPRALMVKDANAIALDSSRYTVKLNSYKLIVFTTKTYINGQLCLGTDELKGDSNPWCLPYTQLQEVSTSTFSNMDIPRNFYIPAGTAYVDTSSGVTGTVEQASTVKFSRKTTFSGQLCLQTADDVKKNPSRCYQYKDINEIATFSAMDVPRQLVIKDSAQYISNYGVTLSESVTAGKHYFNQKAYINGQLCLTDTAGAKSGKCILYSQLSEL